VVFAVPNAAVRRKGGRAGNAVPGLMKGVHDLCIVAPGQRVFFIEVKRLVTQTMSEDQIVFAAKMRARDVPTACVASVDQAYEYLVEWGLVRHGRKLK
jgi:hypothetical protein